jgi:hypothetical protein
LKSEEYTPLLDMIKSLSTKANQSALVTIETIKYIIKEVYPKIENNQEILKNFLIYAEQILHTTKVKDVRLK